MVSAVALAALATIAAMELRRRRRLAAWRWMAHPPRGPRGQAIVEFALIAPVALFTALGFLEAGFLVAEKADQDRRTAVMAEWMAQHREEDIEPVRASQRLTGCTIAEGEEPPGVLTLDVVCRYSPRVTAGLWDGLDIGSTASSVLPAPTPVPSGSPMAPAGAIDTPECGGITTC